MIIPDEVPLEALAGGSFDTVVKLYQDVAQTQPFPLGGYTVSVEVDGVATLTEGNGLTTDAAQGSVQIQMTPAQLTGTPKRTRWRLKLAAAGGVPTYFPLVGDFLVNHP